MDCYEAVAGDGGGVAARAGSCKALPLTFLLNKTTSPARAPAVSPASPRGIQGRAARLFMRVGACELVAGSCPLRLRLVEERSSVKLAVIAMSRVTVTLMGLDVVQANG